jgi:hypothetical protein
MIPFAFELITTSAPDDRLVELVSALSGVPAPAASTALRSGRSCHSGDPLERVAGALVRLGAGLPRRHDVGRSDR